MLEYTLTKKIYIYIPSYLFLHVRLQNSCKKGRNVKKGKNAKKKGRNAINLKIHAKMVKMHFQFRNSYKKMQKWRKKEFSHSKNIYHICKKKVENIISKNHAIKGRKKVGRCIYFIKFWGVIYGLKFEIWGPKIRIHYTV